MEAEHVGRRIAVVTTNKKNSIFLQVELLAKFSWDDDTIIITTVDDENEITEAYIHDELRQLLKKRRRAVRPAINNHEELCKLNWGFESGDEIIEAWIPIATPGVFI